MGLSESSNFSRLFSHIKNAHQQHEHEKYAHFLRHMTAENTTAHVNNAAQYHFGVNKS